jgi:hypothetical protein
MLAYIPYMDPMGDKPLRYLLPSCWIFVLLAFDLPCWPEATLRGEFFTPTGNVMKRQDGRSYLRQRCQCQSCADSWVPWQPWQPWLDPARHAARHAESQRFTVTPWLSGAGKTTMVQHILKNREGLKAVVFPEQFLGKLMENPWKTHGHSHVGSCWIAGGSSCRSGWWLMMLRKWTSIQRRAEDPGFCALMQDDAGLREC